VQVVYNFGREEPGTREVLERLVDSVARHPEPGKARAVAAQGLGFAESRPLGGTWVLDALWERLGIGPALRSLLKGRRLDPSAERVLFALAANRALAPSSKLAAARWASEDVLVTGLDATSDDACYRAMDWLLQVREPLERAVFDTAADVLDLEVDLLFFDTTRTGIPLRVWCWPGNTGDSALIRQVKADLRDWSLSRVTWVADRGSPRRRTAAACARATTTTSSGSGCGSSSATAPRAPSGTPRSAPR